MCAVLKHVRFNCRPRHEVRQVQPPWLHEAPKPVETCKALVKRTHKALRATSTECLAKLWAARSWRSLSNGLLIVEERKHVALRHKATVPIANRMVEDKHGNDDIFPNEENRSPRGETGDPSCSQMNGANPR